MRIGIIGAGNMGSAFARRLGSAGHEVYIASRDIEDAKNVADTLGGDIRAVPQEQLASRADVIIAATPYRAQAEALRAAGDLSGKTVVEISNPLTPDMSGLEVGFTTSAAEEIARHVEADVVKAFNTVFAQVLAGASAPGTGSRVQVFFAGDDDTAKANVRTLIESMGFEPVDAGPLRNARYLEPLGMLNIYFGYAAGMGTDIAPTVQKLTPRDDELRADNTRRERTEPGEERPPAT